MGLTFISLHLSLLGYCIFSCLFFSLFHFPLSIGHSSQHLNNSDLSHLFNKQDKVFLTLGLFPPITLTLSFYNRISREQSALTLSISLPSPSLQLRTIEHLPKFSDSKFFHFIFLLHLLPLIITPLNSLFLVTPSPASLDTSSQSSLQDSLPLATSKCFSAYKKYSSGYLKHFKFGVVKIQIHHFTPKKLPLLIFPKPMNSFQPLKSENQKANIPFSLLPLLSNRSLSLLLILSSKQLSLFSFCLLLPVT